MKKICLIVLIIAMVFTSTACQGLTTFNNFKTAFLENDTISLSTVRIGVYEPLSGEYAKNALEEIKGIELAHELYPNIYGLTVELVYADNKSDMYSGETVITELLKKQPVVVLGSYGETLTLVASKYLADAKVPGITVSSTNPLITLNNEYFFRATYAEESQGEALADFAVNEFERNKAVVVKMADDDTLTSEINSFISGFNEITGDENGVVETISIEQGEDYSDAYKTMAECGASCCFLALQPEAAKGFIEGAIENSLRFYLFMGTKVWDCDSINKFAEDNPSISIAFCAIDTIDTNDLATEFREAYKAKYGEEAEPSGLAATGFDAYIMAITAIKEAYDSINWTEIPSGTIVRDKLLQIKGFEGASGITSFDGTNEAIATVSIHSYHGSTLEQYIEETQQLVDDVTEKEEENAVDIGDTEEGTAEVTKDTDKESKETKK